MRLDFLTLILLLLVHAGAKAQPAATTGATTYLQAIYRLEYKLDSAVATPKGQQMVLRITNGTSCFRSMFQHIADSVYASLSDRPEQERLQKSLDATSNKAKTGELEFQYSIFKEPAKNLVFYHDDIGSADYQYQEKTPLFNWKIMPVKKVVAGYECQQAITAFGGRTWDAWFTRDIPVSEGPYKFYGLPGLIVKVSDTHGHYVFELLSFESNPKPFNISANSSALFSTSPSAPLIKKTKFLQAKHNDDLTIFDRMAASGNIIPPGMQRDYFAKLKRRNNPLELK